MQVKLYKKTSSYVDKKTGEERQATNLYVDCNGKMIPIAVKFFEDENGNDNAYSGRKAILTTFADELPEKEKAIKKPATDSPESANTQGEK